MAQALLPVLLLKTTFPIPDFSPSPCLRGRCRFPISAMTRDHGDSGGPGKPGFGFLGWDSGDLARASRGPPLPRFTPFHATHTPCHPTSPQACHIAYPTSPHSFSALLRVSVIGASVVGLVPPCSCGTAALGGEVLGFPMTRFPDHGDHLIPTPSPRHLRLAWTSEGSSQIGVHLSGLDTDWRRFEPPLCSFVYFVVKAVALASYQLLFASC